MCNYLVWPGYYLPNVQSQGQIFQSIKVDFYGKIQCIHRNYTVLVSKYTFLVSTNAHKIVFVKKLTYRKIYWCKIIISWIRICLLQDGLKVKRLLAYLKVTLHAKMAMPESKSFYICKFLHCFHEQEMCRETKMKKVKKINIHILSNSFLRQINI